MANRAAHQRSHCGHKIYHLTCEEFGALEQESGGRCGICQDDIGVNTLCVDHDHAVGARAIRGMVCPPCNRWLAGVDAGRRQPDPAQSDYLASPWYRRVGISGVCPPHCWNGEHRAWLDRALAKRTAA